MRIMMVFLLVGVGLAGCASEPGTPVDEPAADPVAPLSFLPALDLGSKAGVMDLGVGGLGTSCQDSLDDGDCGLGEPSIEVDGAGTIYVSGVCCLTVSPPVYVSRDNGASFQPLETDTGIREAWGIEGDFAVDQEGRIYFADIEVAATFQMTVWDAEGNYLRHTKWPAPPLVDRDWVRAEGDGHLYYVYNTGSATRVYKSTDAGQTFTPDAIFVAPYGLGNVAIDPGREICLFGGNVGGMRSVDCSQDGGATWTQEAASLPNGDDAYPVGSYDEAGNLWLAEMIDRQLVLTHRTPEGQWGPLINVTTDGHHRMPWIAAGQEGAVALAWYGTNDTAGGGDWFVRAATVTNGTTTPRVDAVIADPEPVFIGNLGRDLLDFLQVDVGPDGAIHIAYSKQRPGQGPDGNEEQLHYVRSEARPELAMAEFWLGP